MEVPLLKPDEQGELAVPFIAPATPGHYERYATCTCAILNISSNLGKSYHHLSKYDIVLHVCSCVHSAFSKTRLLPELRRVLSCESPAVFLHTPPKEKGPWDPFYQLRQVLAKGRHRSTSNLTESSACIFLESLCDPNQLTAAFYAP